MQGKLYLRSLEANEKKWEALCTRCGGCCGAYDDPCRHLRKDKSGKYYCPIYDRRLGLQKAVSGEEFNCVPVREIINDRWKKDHLCNYKKYLRSAVR